MSSLHQRLVSSQTIALLLLLGGFLFAGNYGLRQLSEAFVASRLEHDLDALLLALDISADGIPELNTDRIDRIFQQAYSGHYYRIHTQAHDLYSRSLWDFTLEFAPPSTQSVTVTTLPGPDGQHLLLLSRRFTLDGQAVDVAVAEDLTSLDQGLSRLSHLLLLITGGLLVLGIPLQYWIIHRTLQPLQNLRQALTRLGLGEITRIEQPSPSEIQPLVDELNRLLELTRQRLERSRNALGNLTHALKTPLTVLTQLAQQPSEHAAMQQLQANLLRYSEQIAALMERELRRARIVGAAMPGQRVVLQHELADLCATLSMIYRERQLQLEQQIDPELLFPGDRDDLLELLGNLLDNACKWARQRVYVHAQRHENALWITVEDDGPGCESELLTCLTARGVRVDESRSGHGLGLAIVHDIIEQYQGQLLLGHSSTLGGFCAQVSLPLRSQ